MAALRRMRWDLLACKRLSILLISWPIFAVNGESIVGQTPCCFDRIGSLLCARQKKGNLGAFLHKCMRNADFAFVQCCRTCFDQAEEDPFRLDYRKTSEYLLTNGESAQCWDRRDSDWCQQFAQGQLETNAKFDPIWDWKVRKTAMDCSNVPIAFRLCRKTCGFCATQESPAQVVYDEALAKSTKLCYSPARGFAMQKRNNLDGNSVYRDFVSRFHTSRLRKAKKKGKWQKEKVAGRENWIGNPPDWEEEPRPLFLINE